MPLLEDLDRIKTAQERFIASIEARYAKQAVTLQKRLLSALNEDLMSRLDITNGQILNTTYNYNVIYDFETLWDEYADGYFTPTIRNIANDALKVTALSDPYFKKLGLSASKSVKAFTQATKNVELMMGIEKSGAGMKFIKGGYLDRLLQGAEVKDKVMTILTDSVSVKTGFKELLVNMKGAVEGNAETEGALQSYFRGYVYDTFSGVQSAYDNYVSESVGMNYFVYAGTVIKSTREFCIDHLNQVYHRDDIAEFEAQDWQGKNPDVPFVISRGGYNCRHSLRWIPDELVDEFKKREVNEESSLNIGEEMVGYRYGKAPEGGQSWNYAENKYEEGVSMAKVGNMEELKSVAVMNLKESNVKKHYYIGKIAGQGSDANEILLKVSKEISYEDYKKYLSTSEIKTRSNEIVNYIADERKGLIDRGWNVGKTVEQVEEWRRKNKVK